MRPRPASSASGCSRGLNQSAAIKFCQENGISEVHGECILMFAKPLKFYHKPHRWVWGMIGKLPK